EPAAGTDRWVARVTSAHQAPGTGNADPLDRAGLAVFDEELHAYESGSWHQVGRQRRERHEAAVGADRRPFQEAEVLGIPTRGIASNPVGVLAHALGRPRQAIVDEDVGEIGVPQDQVAGAGFERHEAPISADRSLLAVSIGLGLPDAGIGNADPLDRARL